MRAFHKGPGLRVGSGTHSSYRTHKQFRNLDKKVPENKIEKRNLDTEKNTFLPKECFIETEFQNQSDLG